MKFMVQKENRMGLVQVIIGLVLLILAIIWYIALFIDVKFCIFSCDILILFLGALGLLFIIIGIHSLLPTPPMKGLLLLIIGSILTGVGLYFTRYLLLNFRILKLSGKSSYVYWTNILTIIGILILTYGIIEIKRKVSTRINKTSTFSD
ncbi:hypothetical protein LCGC14_1751960 [marine sediment metagenome]|uniref:Uncharacterized protein n=1 Tax=marine sediment metagenome TaxID=412755 RepID=A0A0F9K301_9ZZZZ